MADANGTPHYTVVTQPAAVDALSRLRDRAIGRRLAGAFADDIERIARILETQPHTWGDPLFDLHVLKMTRRRGHSSMVYVYYFINEPLATVFVQAIDAHPYGPLAG